MNLDDIRPDVDEAADALRAKIKTDGVLIIVMHQGDFGIYGNVDPAHAGGIIPVLNAAAETVRLAVEDRIKKAGH